MPQSTSVATNRNRLTKKKTVAMMNGASWVKTIWSKIMWNDNIAQVTIAPVKIMVATVNMKNFAR
ncbi:hypothetical protein FACS1894218_1370 [Bacilli bacterium]|nr:hypothetical protein FACS1894218_1370 [Bacilli bacterium]